MKTMHRTSTATLTILSLMIGAAATGLASLTGTGLGGIYAFMFLGFVPLNIFLMWPERSRFRSWPSLRSKRSSDR